MEQFREHLIVVTARTIALADAGIDVVFAVIEVVLQGKFREQLYIILRNFSLIARFYGERSGRHHLNFADYLSHLGHFSLNSHGITERSARIIVHFHVFVFRTEAYGERKSFCTEQILEL